ncbi:uncharacterized protein LOC122721561 [Manihot esculenta]|uniref:Uncharacterized protein n=1 Tax=Manihot esculenta TaxID=3983 RepID=A0ACB7GJZ4_MANES|nr:uncharacterized protein LOC122721561 [Manihot esculenta]XP_043805482.1 uncharacterized protein LOC122721561 [Manihot esculenta]XP_043805483.1 uncharacterized protein LOC122721561 [Manihot esculenta]KAG8640582.1 hypothetical protein MANES_13G067750v8 [Manihot esculenta]
MSFLAGRLAGKEAAFFFQESKHAVNRLAEKSIPAPKNLPSSPLSSEQESQADVLPEVLRHSLPSYIFGKPTESSTISTASKWALHSNSDKVATVSPDALNPLRAYLSLPHVTFGPKRWELPSQESSVLASTANEMRKDRYTPINPEKLKAAAEGLTQIGKAFAVATAIVFGGATVVFSLAVSKLQLQNSDDIRTKGKDLVQPKLEIIKEQLVPLKTWAENTSKKWHINREEDIKEKPIVKELSKFLGAKTSN